MRFTETQYNTFRWSVVTVSPERTIDDPTQDCSNCIWTIILTVNYFPWFHSLVYITSYYKSNVCIYVWKLDSLHMWPVFQIFRHWNVLFGHRNIFVGVDLRYVNVNALGNITCRCHYQLCHEWYDHMLL